MRIQFLGATRQVTGSRYYLEADGARILIDSGMFQERDYLERNWQKPPVALDTIDAIILTHAHLDHCGLIPRLVRNGFRGRILTTAPTVDLAAIILRDSAKIQKEDIEYKKKRHRKEGRKSPHPYEPLYTVDDVDQAMRKFEGFPYRAAVPVAKGVTAMFHDAGHILGSSSVALTVRDQGRDHRIVFSGDIGQADRPIVEDPETFAAADWVVMESTYGDRDHRKAGPPDEEVATAMRQTLERGGRVVIPAFAVERAQEVLYHLARFAKDGAIPKTRVYLDSPMAVNVTDVFGRYTDWFDQPTRDFLVGEDAWVRYLDLHLVRSVDESKHINATKGPCIIVSSSGMCTAGRVKHHLKYTLPRDDSLVVLVGYQAHGTLGRHLANGGETARIHGREWPVRARVMQIHGMSAHADRAALLDWIGHFRACPRRVFLTHGEERAAVSLAAAIRRRRPRCSVATPKYRKAFELRPDGGR